MTAKNIHEIYWDQYQYLGNCPLTPPLTQQQSNDKKLGYGRGRWAVAQILILIQKLHEFRLQFSFKTRNKIPHNGEIKLIL